MSPQAFAFVDELSDDLAQLAVVGDRFGGVGRVDEASVAFTL